MPVYIFLEKLLVRITKFEKCQNYCQFLVLWLPAVVLNYI